MADQNRMMNFHSSILQVASIIKNNEQKKAEESFDIDKKKRERKANYSPEETTRLVALIIPKKNILENKKNGANQWQDKKKAWEDIERDFNFKSDRSNYRDSKTLRLKYESLKRDIKKKWSAILAKRRDSDGKLPKFTAAEKKLKEIMQLPIEEGFCDFSSMNDRSDDDDKDSSDSSPLDTYMKDPEWSQVKKEITHTDDDETNFDINNDAIEFQLVNDEPPTKRMHENQERKQSPQSAKNVITGSQPTIDAEPLSKRMHEDPLVVINHQNANTRNDETDINLQEEKLKAARLQTELLRQELEMKKLQTKILEEEFIHKRTIHELEKQHLELKLKNLK